MSAPIGVQLNNPLNVRPTPAEMAKGRSDWQGVVAIESTPSGPFLHFDGPPKGWRCAAGNVVAHYDRWQHDTIATLIGGTPGDPSRPGWAPPEDRNNTAGYIARVSVASGFPSNMVLNFHRYDHLKPVLIAMATVEQDASPYTWWNDAQINWGLSQYGVLPPVNPLVKAGPIAGAATATVAVADAVLPVQPPPVPSVPMAPSTGIDPGDVIVHAQTILQQYGYLFKYGTVLLLACVAAGLAWHWWKQHQKNKPGPGVEPYGSLAVIGSFAKVVFGGVPLWVWPLIVVGLFAGFQTIRLEHAYTAVAQADARTARVESDYEKYETSVAQSVANANAKAVADLQELQRQQEVALANNAKRLEDEKKVLEDKLDAIKNAPVDHDAPVAPVLRDAIGRVFQ